MPLLVTLLLLAATPQRKPVAEAVALAHSRKWDELYLRFAAVRVESLSKPEAVKVAAALGKGCTALLSTDVPMALSLAETSLRFALAPEPLWCAARASLQQQQRTQAEGLLRQGVGAYPNDGRFGLELARLLLDENQPFEAERLLGAVPNKSAHRAQLDVLLDRVHAARAAQASPVALRADDGPPIGASSYESAVDGEGRRTRSNQYFRFRYFSGERDFGQRAEYETAVQAALEKARLTVMATLGATRSRPVDVVLYSREEFALHHGAAWAAAVAGFYSQDAIRMNDSAELNQRTQATLVHEYTHAVVDGLLESHSERLPAWLHEGIAEWVEWRFLGHDGPPLRLKKDLALFASQGRLPSLDTMTSRAPIAQEHVDVRYALCGAAVGELKRRAGLSAVVGLLQEVAAGAPFTDVFEKRFGVTVQRFDEGLANDLKSR